MFEDHIVAIYHDIEFDFLKEEGNFFVYGNLTLGVLFNVVFVGVHGFDGLVDQGDDRAEEV